MPPILIVDLKPIGWQGGSAEDEAKAWDKESATYTFGVMKKQHKAEEKSTMDEEDADIVALHKEIISHAGVLTIEGHQLNSLMVSYLSDIDPEQRACQVRDKARKMITEWKWKLKTATMDLRLNYMERKRDIAQGRSSSSADDRFKGDR